jgi:hypothetical protein
MVEHRLPKPVVAGSIPVSRSNSKVGPKALITQKLCVAQLGVEPDQWF